MEKQHDYLLFNKTQKIYTSMEIQPNFANSGKAYLVGLAVTDDPSSLGTEMLTFSSQAQTNPLAHRKTAPDNLFSVTTEVQLEFEEVVDVEPTLLSRITALFGRKQSSDDACFNDVHEAVAVVAGQVQTNAEQVEQRFSRLEQQHQQTVAELSEQLEASQQEIATLTATLAGSESLSQTRRPTATGGEGERELLTTC